MPKPASRTRLSAEQRRQEILRSARKVFETHGYEDWTIDDIAKDAGVVEGTVLHYFKSKKNLIATVIEEFYEVITEEMEDGVRAISGVRNQIHFVVFTHTKMLIKNAELCALMLRVSRESNRDLGTKIYELNRRYTSVIPDIIESGKVSGEIAGNLPNRLLRNLLFGTMEHYLWDYLYGKKEVDPRLVADELTDFIYTAISQTPDNPSAEINQLILKLNRLL